jgi:excisionase family DNA binding protein
MTTTGRSNKLHAAGQPMTIRQAADYHQVDIKTIRRWIQQGRITAHRTGPRLIRLDRDSVLNVGRRIGGPA